MIDLLLRRVFPWFEQLLGEVVTPEVSSSATDPDPRRLKQYFLPTRPAEPKKGAA